MRNDYAVEFSDGHSVVEDDASVDQWKYSGAEACGRYAAVFLLSRAGLDRGGGAMWRRESGEWRWPERWRAFVTTQRRAGRQLYGFERCGVAHCVSVCARFQTLQS